MRERKGERERKREREKEREKEREGGRRMPGYPGSQLVLGSSGR